VSREITENLVRVGAFDSLGVRREELLAHLPLLYAGGDRRGARTDGAARIGGGVAPAAGLDQPRLILDEELAPLGFLPSWTEQQRVSAELEILGLNVSAHPLAFVRDHVEHLRTTPFARLRLVSNGRHVRLAGVLERAQMPWIRSGHRTLFLTLEDETDLAEVVVFNDVYLKYGRVLKEAVYLFIEGELQNSDERGLAIVAQRITDLAAVLGRNGRLPSEQSAGERHGAFAYRRPDAWELPAVAPRTRPGRTG
jgi:error-prone DNA polymerase